MRKTFLEAEWRKLAMANYSVNPEILKKYIPGKTEPDLWNGVCYLSLVGFMFLNTKVKGIRIPFHTDFEEVNLRFYVKHYDGQAWKRGVVFIKEIVSKPALTLVANTAYGENYETMPMANECRIEKDFVEAEYKWKKTSWNSLRVKTGTVRHDIKDGSEEEFITEHYWGYTKQKNDRTSEYGVEHPRWQVYNTIDYDINVDFGKVYGDDFAFLKNEKPVSVFLAEGSEIRVKEGRFI